MSKLTITAAVKVIPVSESTLRRDLKSGKVSFDTDGKGASRLTFQNSHASMDS